MVAVKPDSVGMVEVGGSQELWRLPSGTSDVPTPVIHDGLVYMPCEGGRRDRNFLVVLDAKTGQEKYRQPLHESIYRASPIVADGKLYITARDGTFTVVKLGPKFEKLAENQLPDTFTASPAISNGRIYLRGWNTLYAIGQAEK